MVFKMLPYGSLLFAAIRKTQVESISFSVLHKLANQQKALDGWTQIEGSGPGSLAFVLDKLLEAKNATISLPLDHIQPLLMIAKLSTWTYGDWSDWAARFYEDQTKAGEKASLTPEKVAESIRSHESLKNSTSHLGNGNGKSANSVDRMPSNAVQTLLAVGQAMPSESQHERIFRTVGMGSLFVTHACAASASQGREHEKRRATTASVFV